MSQPLLSASQIFDAEDLTHEDVTVPEWNLDLRIQQLNAEETTEFSRDMDTNDGAANGMYLILVHSVRTLDGARVLTVEHLPELKRKNIKILNRLQVIALRINGMGVEGQAALKKD